MGVIWTPQQQTKQPSTISRLNPRHPLTASTIFSFDGKTAVVGARPYPTFVGGATLSGANQVGRGLAVLGGSYDAAYWSLDKGTIAASDALSLEFFGTFSSLPSLAALLCITDLTDLTSISLGGKVRGSLSFSGGSPPNVYWWGSQNDYDSGDPFALNRPQHIVMTKAAGTGAVAINVYQNGVKIGSGLSSNSSAFVALTPAYLHLGGRHTSGASSATGVFNKASLFSKELSAVEVTDLYQRPWETFAPERRLFFFNVASGGGSIVSGVGSSTGTATASGVITSTSAQVGSASGTGTASGIGASTANSVGSSSGTGAASGVGSSTGGSDGAGSSSGTGTATGVGASTAASVGSTDGVGTASGVGASTAASTGSTSGTGTATGVGENGSVTVSGVGSASGTGTATGIAPSHGGGNGTGRNLSRKQKKKLKAVESQEWLKAEETARQLLNDRFTKQTPQEKAQALQTYVESLQPVIEALKALTVPEVEIPEEPIIELTPHQEILTRFDTLEKKLKSVEELVIILMADL